ncbi:hypothetical protein AYK26_04695 [Euryarchaeota archaeon SM23-78]|nr:MAG: hypothetical protein AYK26_04695 [Euryarchaeota archaeon SM23-78]MBW3001173.1 hypothetical protein [Candidatus Woesearchaeota archaeon]
MNKKTFIIGLVVVLVLLLFTSCKPSPPESDIGPLFNESLNKELEELTTVKPGEFEPFFFKWSERNESKYEIAEDDIFTMTRGNFTSSEISFFGLMLGDSYEDVLERLGIPDVMFILADKSYKNLEYRNKIGINGTLSGLTFHLENDTVTRITVKPPFKKYMHGNTSVGTDKEIIYALLDVPDYQSFLSSLRVFYYVEKGVEVYFKNRYVDRISFLFPQEFKGVEYVTEEHLTSEGIVVNTTEPVLIE